MRIFKVVSTLSCLANEYITEGETYTLNGLGDSVYYCRASGSISCSYMRMSKFKQALREGAIIFID